MQILAGCGGEPAARQPDNVLLITLDTTRADALSPYGAGPEVTPVAARLAAEGVTFDRAYTVTPLTIPAHSSLLTGLLPPRHGVRDNGDFFLSDEALTLAERLRAGGWQTMAAVGAEVTSHHWGFAQGFDAYFDDMGPTTKGNRWRVERRGDAVVDDALGWLAGASAERPWLAWVHLFDAHHPYEAPEPQASAFPGKPYLAEVAWADAQIGRVIDHLAQTGALDSTWVVMVADHGEGHGEHGERTHGTLLYDGTMRIPLIIRPPGGRAAARVAFPVSLVDVLPTLLAGLEQPGPEVTDGLDLGPWLRDPSAAAPTDRLVYMESLYAWHHYGWSPQRAVASAEYKLFDSTSPELYAADDGRERFDLTPIREAEVRGLQDRVDALAAEMTRDDALATDAALSPDRVAQLEALGYLTTDIDTEGAAPFRAGLPEPAERLPVLRDVEQIRVALQGGDLDKAAAAAERVAAREPGLVQARMMQARIFGMQGKTAEALALLRSLDALRPSAPVKAMLGMSLLPTGDVEGALTELEAATTIDPYHAPTWTPYLHALLGSGAVPKLEAEVARALELMPDLAVARGMQGVLAGMAGRHTEAEALLRDAIAADPLAPFLHQSLGFSLHASGRDVEAEEALAEEVRLHPPAPLARRTLVEILAAQRRYAEQLVHLEVISKIEPPTPLTAHSLAQVLFNLERYGEAEQAVEACIELAPDYPACAMLRANVLQKLGREAEAQAAYLAALEMAGQAP